MQMNQSPLNTAPFLVGATLQHEHEKEEPLPQEDAATQEESSSSSPDQNGNEEVDRESLLRRSTLTALAEEEDYPDPDSLQEELNEILEAWFEIISEDDIAAYQRYIEDIRGERVAERALTEPALAPTFSLVDQDGDQVDLSDLIQQNNKPVVVVFYRGKWCPHCNATLMRYQNDLVPVLQQHFGVPLVAISPMLPDGTVYLASKRSLQFAVCSDPQSTVAQQFGITFQVQPHTQPFMEKWGEDVPLHNGIPEDWTLPIPAVYVIGTDGQIAWSFVDNDPGIRAEPTDILQAVAAAMPLSSDNDTQSASTLNRPAEQEVDQEENQKAGIQACIPCHSPNRRRTERDHGSTPHSPGSNKKKKKLFNRKTGYISLRKSCQGFFASLSSSSAHGEGGKQKGKDAPLAGQKQLHHHHQDDDQSHGTSQARSHGHRSAPFRASSHTSRTFRASQTSSEFLMNYVLPPPGEM